MALSLFIATEKSTQGTTRSSIPCCKLIVIKMAEHERQGIKKGPQKKTGCQVSFAKTTEKELTATKRKLKEGKSQDLLASDKRRFLERQFR